MGFAEAMILEYNGKKKFSPHRLSINKLYVRDYFSTEFGDEEEETYIPNDEKIIESENYEDFSEESMD